MNSPQQEPDAESKFVFQMETLMEHRFHSIEEDITLLVFFARTPAVPEKK